jgi:hypothetical protein
LPSNSCQANESIIFGNNDTVIVSLMTKDNRGCISKKDSTIIIPPCSNGGTLTFTNCGATGNLGPTQQQVNVSYGIGLINSNGGIQEWQVPLNVCTITIEAWGASGGANNIKQPNPG